MSKVLRRIRFVVCTLCFFGVIVLSYQMPDMIYAYESRKSEGKTEKVQIKEVELNLYSDLDFFQKIRVMSEADSVVELKQGWFLDDDTARSKLFLGLDAMLLGTHAFTKKSPSMYNWNIKYCKPKLYSDSFFGKSFIMWDLHADCEAGTVIAGIDDETGIILCLSYSVYNEDGTDFARESMSEAKEWHIQDKGEVLKRYIDYVMPSMPEILREAYTIYDGLPYYSGDDGTEIEVDEGLPLYMTFIKQNCQISVNSSFEHITVMPGLY